MTRSMVWLVVGVSVLGGCSLRADVRDAQDMPEDMTTSTQDMGAAQDMGAQPDMCDESDEALCARLELECGLLPSVVDACGRMRSVQCGMCPGDNGVCKNNKCEVCGQSACPTDGRCGDIQDACGATVSCGCGDDQVCDGSGMCSCPAIACTDSQLCGEVRNACGATAQCEDTCAPQGLECIPDRYDCGAQRHMASVAIAGHDMGWSVALSSGRLLVGAPGRGSGGNLDVGEVQYWERLDGKRWEMTSQYQPMLEAGSRFGESVAMLGDLIVVGAPGAAEASGMRAGVATLYKRASGAWTALHAGTTDDPQSAQRAGERVALDVTGGLTHMAYSATGQGLSGRVYVQTAANPEGLAWSSVTLPATSPGGSGRQVGTALALRSGVLAFSITSTNSLMHGQLQIYRYNDATGWALDGTIDGSAAPDASKMGFGKAVALNGAGTMLAVTDSGGLGNVHLFVRDNTDTWQHKRTLTSPDAHTGQRFGASLALTKTVVGPGSDDVLVVGAPTTDATRRDKVYVFAIATEQLTVLNTRMITALNAGEGLGTSVAASVEDVVAGAPLTDGGAGSFYAAPRLALPQD